jgi:hypothetical protein
METKTVKSAAFVAEFETKYGQLFKYMYTFTDGTQGECNHKTNSQKWNDNQEVMVEKKGEHNGIAKLSIQSVESAQFGGTVTPNAPSGGGGRDQNVIGTQWAINSAIKWIEFTSQDPSIESFNQIAAYARELIKMRDNIDTYKQEVQSSKGPF